MIRAYKPDAVLNVALPYQDLTIMDACLEAGAEMCIRDRMRAI